MASLRARILVVVFALCSLQTAEGNPDCNCTSVHPQEHYCQADYVIRGRVLLLRWELNPDIEMESSTVTDPMTDPVAGHSSSEEEVDKASQTNLTSSSEEEDGVKSTVPSTSASNTSNDSMTIGAALPAYRRNGNLLHNPIINQEPWNYRIVFTIAIQDVYKMPASLQEGAGETELISPYPGAGFCGVQLMAGKSYILAGHEEGMITRCDWAQEYRELTKLQKRGLKKNYKNFCDKCQIETCLDQDCEGTLSAKTCAYLPTDTDDNNRSPTAYPSTDCMAKYQLCQPTSAEAEECKWSSSKDSRACNKKDKDKGKSKARKGRGRKRRGRNERGKKGRRL